MYKISDFSKLSGFSSRMLRHLEELDLLIPNRNDKNYRFYDDEQIPIAIKIKSFQKMGFSLKEIKAILSMSLDQLEENLTQLFKTKQEENKRTEKQLTKIRLVQNAIKNKNYDFSFIEQLDEVDADDRAQIILGFQELANRVVKGRLPRVEIINEDMFKLLTTGNEQYEHDSVDLYKFGEYFKLTPKAYYALFEVEELVCYFFISITEDELIKNLDYFNIKSSDIYDSNFTETISKFCKNIMANYIKAWKSTYMPLNINYKGFTDDKEKISNLFSFNEVLLKMTFARTDKDESLKFTLGTPVSVIKAVDSATPYK